jgi:uncharacterized protein YoxC
MELWLTALSGLEVLVFLAALLVALSRIRKALEHIQHSMQRISWGVNAIASQTAPLREHGRTLLAQTEQLAGVLETTASRLGGADIRLAQLEPTLGQPGPSGQQG